MTREKITETLNKIFGWCILLSLFAGALSFLGFCIALIMGGSSGEAFAIFLQKQYFPVIIRLTTVVICLGLAAMYTGKVQALSLTTDKDEAEQELEQIKKEQNNDN